MAHGVLHKDGHDLHVLQCLILYVDCNPCSWLTKLSLVLWSSSVYFQCCQSHIVEFFSVIYWQKFYISYQNWMCCFGNGVLLCATDRNIVITVLLHVMTPLKIIMEMNLSPHCYPILKSVVPIPTGIVLSTHHPHLCYTRSGIVHVVSENKKHSVHNR